MKIIIPSKGRPMSLRTHKYLDASGLEYRIFLHNEQEKSEYLKNPTIDPAKIIITGVPYGISNQRQWIIDNYIKLGEWYVTLDDNIHYFTTVIPSLYNEEFLDSKNGSIIRENYEYKITAGQFLKHCEEDIKIAEKTGANYCGFAVVDNYYFRERKYRQVGYVISKVAIIKHVGINYDPNIKAMDDYAFTAENLKEFGRVLINNFIYPVSGHYEAGGIGTYVQRLPKKIQDAKYLINKYPGLFRYKIKVGCDPKAELQIRLNDIDQVKKWQDSLNQLNIF